MKNKRYQGLSILLSVLLISAVLLDDSSAAPTPKPQITSAPLVGPKGTQAPTYGFVFNSGGTEKIDIWEDFQCLHCGSFENLMGGFLQNVIKEGKVNVTFHTLAFLGVESDRLANGAACASDEGKFLKYHQHFFELQSPTENAGIWTTSYLLAQAKTIGLSSKKFVSCVTSGKYKTWLQFVNKNAFASKLTSTPTVLINDVQINRSTDYTSLTAFSAVVADPSKIVVASPTPTSSPIKINFGVSKTFGEEPTVGTASGTPPSTFGKGDIILGTGNLVQVNDTITVQEKIIDWQTNKVLASTWASGPVTFKLTGRIKGLQDGIPGMKVGGRRLLIVPPSLGFGPAGNASVPPNATLIYVIDLLAATR